MNKGVPYISDCVIAELEKLGHKSRLALKYFITDSLATTKIHINCCN